MLNRQTRTNLSIYSWILYYNVRLVAAILRVCFECQLISVWSGHSIGMDWQYGFQQWYNFDCFQIILDTFGVSVLFLCCLVGEVDFCANKWNYRKQPYNKCHTLEYIRLDSAMYVSAGQILLETVLCLCHRGKNRFFVSFASNFISHSCFIHWTRFPVGIFEFVPLHVRHVWRVLWPVIWFRPIIFGAEAHSMSKSAGYSSFGASECLFFFHTLLQNRRVSFVAMLMILALGASPNRHRSTCTLAE